MNEIIKEDIKNLVYSLANSYNTQYSLDFLYDRYIPNIIIKCDKPKKKRIVTFKKSNTIPSYDNRCMARCWGGKHTVKYNPITKKWTYGLQCSRTKSHGHYCLTHYKQSKLSKGLTHGNFNQEPPHPHYLKYKNKIEYYFKIN